MGKVADGHSPLTKGLSALRKRGADRAALALVSRIPCNPANLGVFDSAWLDSAWAMPGWDLDGGSLHEELPEAVGGVNFGDRRALYHLVRRLKPRRILEVGTHVGSSTAAMALAGRRNATDGYPCQIDTVDIHDVNHPTEGGWVSVGAAQPPVETLRALGVEENVSFFKSDSREWLARGHEPYDMIFLDGSHAAQCVYREIPLALGILAPGGIVVLHDFFPDGAPLWQGKRPALGPWLAVARHVKEGAGFRPLPLGALPWPTKLGTNVTSLAILSRRSS
jgi:predicted O-methyltransferase YrrM